MGVYVMTENSTANQPTAQNKPKSKGQGDFFIIDIETWQNIYDDISNSLNTGYLNDTKATRILASYLVLACGTGGDNVTSRWSATSCQKYAGFSFQTGKVAIEYLEQLGHISIAPKKKATAKNNTYKLNKPKQGNEIYIPKSLIMGVNGEITAINRLYLESNPHLLYLFIRLYAFQYKTLDIIDPNLVSSLLVNSEREYPEIVYNESGRLNVWGISDFWRLSAKNTSNFFKFNPYPVNFKFKDDDSEVWAFYHKLASLGLIHQVNYACVGDDYSDPNEIDPICEIDSLTQQHFCFLLECLSEQYRSDDKQMLWKSVISNNDKLVTLPSNYQKVHFAKFYRLTYRTTLGDNLRFEQERKINRTVNDAFKSLASSQFAKDTVIRGEKNMIERNLL